MSRIEKWKNECKNNFELNGINFQFLQAKRSQLWRNYSEHIVCVYMHTCTITNSRPFFAPELSSLPLPLTKQCLPGPNAWKRASLSTWVGSVAMVT